MLGPSDGVKEPLDFDLTDSGVCQAYLGALTILSAQQEELSTATGKELWHIFYTDLEADLMLSGLNEVTATKIAKSARRDLAMINSL